MIRKISLMVFAGALILGLAGWFVLKFLPERELRRIDAELEALGRPTTVEDLVPPPVPEEENGAELYRQAIAVFQRVSVDGRSLDDIKKLFNDEETEAEGKALLLNAVDSPEFQAGLDLLEQANARPRVWHDLEYSKGFGLVIPNLSETINLSQYLHLATERLGDADRDREAWHIAMLNLDYSGHMGVEPLLICQVVWFAQYEIAAEALFDLLNSSVPPPEIRRDLIAKSNALEFEAGLKQSLEMERLVGQQTIEELDSLDFGLGSPGFQETGVWLLYLPVKNFDQVFHQRTMLYMMKEAEKPFPLRDPNTEEKLFRDVPRWAMLTRMTIPALWNAHATALRAQARADLLLAGLALMEHRERVGAFPDSLLEVAGEIPVDPFSLEPFRYVPRDDGFLLYSVGPNLEDDGGKNDKPRGELDDVVWEYKRH